MSDVLLPERPLRELHLFAGAGGGILGGILLGHTCVCAVEIEPYCRKVLLQRQRDGILPKFPIWDDVRTFDGKPWRGSVDVVCSGFPCQRHSNIGKLHGSEGFDGWPDTARIVEEVRPRWILLENVTAILRGYWWGIIGKLSELGYDTKWGTFSACSVGAPHTRERVFCMAHSRRIRLETPKSELEKSEKTRQSALPSPAIGAAWRSRIPKPSVPSMVDGLADYVEQIAAIGDGQVPSVVRLAWNILSG